MINMFLSRIYYLIKPLIPRKFQIYLRSKNALWMSSWYEDVWPINKNAAGYPANWNSWPENKKFAFILTHDVEFESGHDKSLQLMELEKRQGFQSSFYFVPELYPVSKNFINILNENNF